MKLTKRTVDAVEPTGSDVIHWDEEIPGFGYRVKPSGVCSWVVQYRAKGRTRRVTLARAGVFAPEQAREAARKMLAQVRGGGDPSEDRRQARAAETVEELCRRFLDQYAPGRKKARSIENDRHVVDRLINPALGKRKVADVTRADVQRLHVTLGKAPYMANRTLALLSRLMTLAEKWGLRPDGSNPCRHVERFPEKKRERFLASAELAKLGEVLAAVEHENVEWSSVVPAIRLLLFTGARLSEILTLRWEHVDLERGCLNLPDSKTGAKTVHLNPPALKVLSEIEREEGTPWVIRGRRENAHLIDLEHPWQRIRKRAGLKGVRIHDLRHTFASAGAAVGSSLPMLGALLGHTQAATTARYAHLAADPLKEVNDRIGARIAAALRVKKRRARVVPLRVGEGAA